MRKVFTFFLLLIVIAGFAQQRRVSPETYVTSNGKYTISYFSDNILKLTFTTTNYSRNENVSDAVILKPGLGSNGIHVEIKDRLVNIGNKAILLDTDTSHGYHCFNFALQKDEMIFGGGERALPLDRRGYHFNLYNNPWYGYGEGADNLNYSVPFFTSSKGYALFFDNPSKGFADIGKENKDVFKVGFSSGELNVYIILGKDYKEILSSYHKLTGTQPLPPRWALGNLMSRFGYTSEAQVKDILSKMKQENVPVEAVIFDLFWFGDSIKGTLGNLEWINLQRWPDPKRMIGEFRKQGINTILVTEPFFVETSKNYSASKKYLSVDSAGKPYYLTDFYFGKGGLIDIFRKDSKDWFWSFYKKQMNIGVEAWWGDLGEPEKHPSDLYHNLKDLGQKRLFSADEVHNIYGHNWTKMLFEKYAQQYPNKRLFSLNRSGFAGSQRYSIFPWTGDVSRSWNGLRAQLPILLGMSMSGVPYVHSDAGGFAGGEGDKELYVRWLQFAAFTPIFRPHGTALYDVEPAAFSFPSEVALIDGDYKTWARTAIYYRYTFSPYNYTLAYLQAKYGQPLIAPLYYHFPSDTTASKIEDEYMWGEDVLVAPVLQKGAVTRKYYLPEGNWYHYFRDEVLEGKSWQEDKVNMAKFPLLFREGSFIVRNGIGQLSRFKGDTLLVMHVPSAKPSVKVLYHDNGISKNSLKENKYELITFRSYGIKAHELRFSITSNKGKYENKPGKRQINFLFGRTFHHIDKVTVNGVPLGNKGKNNFVLEGTGLSMELEFTGKPLEIVIKF
jgi:oligosaccharide 4-alpha-D-glucosyltransferase